MTPLRFMTYNIFRGGRSGPVLADVVRRAAPDVLVVNESPKAPLGWRSRCRRLARACGLRYVGGGRDAGSNMLVVSGAVTVRWSAAEVLPQPHFQPRRGIVSAQLVVGGAPVGVVGCHLSLDGRRRRAEVERVLAVADRLDGPVVVAGDLNEGPQGACWRRLRQEGYADHGSGDWLTFPSRAPERRIDALLVRGGSVAGHGDPGVPERLLARASDHRPVAATVVV